MRRLLSSALCALGFVLVIAGSWIYVKAAVAQVLLRSAWGEARAGNGEARPWPWADTWPVARLRSAEHGVDLIVLEGATGSTTAFGPGHIVGTAEPGAVGNVGLAAHRDTHFAFLEQVRLGDQLSLDLPDGRHRQYEISALSVVRQTDTQSLASTEDALTLVTCYPFHAATPGGPLRYVVQARALEGETRCYPKEPRWVSTHVKEVPSAECPIGPGSTRPSLPRGAANPARTWGTRY